MTTSDPNRLAPSFKWLNATQFFGALNDNLFQQFLIFALIAVLGAEQEGAILAQAGVMFVIPFLLFAAPAGLVADRFSKKSIIVTGLLKQNVDIEEIEKQRQPGSYFIKVKINLKWTYEE
jgi:MFS family permease